MTIIHSNGSKWAGEKPDNLLALKRRLNTYKLENWSYIKQVNGKWEIAGNFVNISAVFNITTDEPNKVRELKKLFKHNSLIQL